MLIEDKYYTIKAISSSSLRFIDPKEGGSPRKFKRFLDGVLRDDEEMSGEYLVNGTLVHMKMLEPDKLVIAKAEKPAGALGDIADQMLKEDIEISEENILDAINTAGWNSRYADATKIKKFEEAGCITYIEEMRKAINTGKISISKNNGVILTNCETAFLTDDACKFWLVDIDDEEGFEVHNEVEVVWTQKVDGIEMKFKAKIDKLILDHNTGQFYILDVKTTGKPISLFPFNFVSYNYPRQISFYKVATYQLLKQRGLNFKFGGALIAAVETNNDYAAQIFEVTDYVNEPNQELKDLIKRLSYHFGTGDWINPPEKYNNGGVITLKREEYQKASHS